MDQYRAIIDKDHGAAAGIVWAWVYWRLGGSPSMAAAGDCPAIINSGPKAVPALGPPADLDRFRRQAFVEDLEESTVAWRFEATAWVDAVSSPATTA